MRPAERHQVGAASRGQWQFADAGKPERPQQPRGAARDRERRKAVAELDLLSSLGLLALTVPRAYGGADVSAETLAQVFQIVAAADVNKA